LNLPSKRAHSKDNALTLIPTFLLGRLTDSLLLGNIRFRSFIDEMKPEYLAASRTEKPKVAAVAVAKWRRLNPPGRFLTRTNPTEVDAVYHDIGDTGACRKASQCLRAKREPKPGASKILFGNQMAASTASLEEDPSSASIVSSTRAVVEGESSDTQSHVSAKGPQQEQHQMEEERTAPKDDEMQLQVVEEVRSADPSQLRIGGDNDQEESSIAAPSSASIINDTIRKSLEALRKNHEDAILNKTAGMAPTHTYTAPHRSATTTAKWQQQQQPLAARCKSKNSIRLQSASSMVEQAQQANRASRKQQQHQQANAAAAATPRPTTSRAAHDILAQSVPSAASITRNVFDDDDDDDISTTSSFDNLPSSTNVIMSAATLLGTEVSIPIFNNPMMSSSVAPPTVGSISNMATKTPAGLGKQASFADSRSLWEDRLLLGQELLDQDMGSLSNNNNNFLDYPVLNEDDCDPVLIWETSDFGFSV
jgi:hypothetical protein